MLTSVVAEADQKPAATLPKLAGVHKAAQPTASPQGLSVFEVSVDSESFNPTRGTKSQLNYRLSREAKVTVKVFDADRQFIRGLASTATRKAGLNREIWDGQDLDGKVVPNEAYFFTIEATDSAGNKVVHDPVTFSGGEFADITHGEVNRERGTVTYKLSQPSRVLMRAGMTTGLLLKTIVDWEPRSSGTITDYWNGKDDDGMFDVSTVKGTTMVLTYMTLPATSVITIGNDKTTYREYKRAIGAKRPLKEDRPMANARKISPHFLKSRVADRAFKVNVTFPDLDKSMSASGVPEIKDSALFRISVADQDKEVLAGQQFELMMHVDTNFLLEEERGYLPFTSPLEVKALPPGEHILTINIITFGDQIGVGSRKIRVVR
jgi:flagellar hook assembly protein FlgD